MRAPASRWSPASPTRRSPDVHGPSTRVRTVLLSAVFGLTAGACNDLTRPVSEPTEEDPRATGPGILLPVAYQETPKAHCLDNPATVIHEVDGITYCVVGMDDMITALVEGGAGVPPPPPELPTIGVNPPVNYWDWPTPPGGGGIEPGPGEGCDPEAIMNPCAHFDAFLGCPVDGVERGATGRCFLHVEPDTALEGINQWRFNGENIDAFSNHQDTIWEGALVESGLVTVFFQAYGRESSETTVLGVLPRETGIWTQSHWESQITYDSAQGNMNCALSQPRLELVNNQARVGWIQTLNSAQQGGCQPQRVEPVGFQGFEIDEVESGPNEGAWYVVDASFNWKSASLVHPDLSPGASTYTLTDTTQAQLCRSQLGIHPDSAVVINLDGYNATCAQVSNWSSFVPAAWTHEGEHFEQAEALLTQAGSNLYGNVEALVRNEEAGSDGIYNAVIDEYDNIDQAARLAGGQEPTGNWSGTFWVWAGALMHWFAQPSGNL